MSEPNPLKTPELEFKSLLALVLVASLLFGAILWPFFGSVCWAVFIALVFWPLHRRMVAGSGGQPNLAAAASVAAIVLIVILPLALVAGTVAQEAAAFVGRLRSGELRLDDVFDRVVQALPHWVRSLLERFGLTDLSDLYEKLRDGLGASGHTLTARAFSIGHGTLEFIVGFFVMLYLLFFLLRDGQRLVDTILRASPLRQEHTMRLLGQFATVVRATVKGNVVIAIVQGALGGIAFAVLGVPGPALWGAVMAVLALLPHITAVVWAPVALWLLFKGETLQGLGLIAWGVLVIGLVDNLLRPILVGKDTRMPDYLVLLATLGGLAVWGLNGFVIGPVIAAVFLVSWEMLAAAREEPVPPEPGAQDQDTM